DEPMAFLDPAGKKELQRVMDGLSASGRTVVVTTHDMQLVAEWADDVIVMKEGACLGVMTPSALFSNRALLAATKLELPPAAAIAAALWNGEPDKLPIRVGDIVAWLQASGRA